MSRVVLILRPEPGAGESASRARMLGLDPVVAPLFTVDPLTWTPPHADRFDAIILTSANAARHGGPALSRYLALPCYAVGESTASAAQAAGFREIITGPAGGAALIRMIAASGAESVIHLCGEDRIALSHPQVRVSALPVYAARADTRLSDDASSALARQALVLLHSPRAAARFADLCRHPRGEVAIAAISPASAAAAGGGWKQVSVASAPRDQALLELAAELCQTGR